jgi:thiosulfate reductase/polysulfide reductase chain A
VLPDTSYLERLEAPELFAGIKPTAVLRDKVLEKIHAETRPVDQIFTELAQACGVGQYFDFTVEELADAQLKSIGLSLSALQASGSVQFEGEPFAYGTLPDLTTATGTFQFTSEACEKAGFTPSPEWIEPMVTPESGKLRLISGEQAVQTHTLTANIPDLMRVTENYRLTDPWLNAGVAEQLDIRDGDTIELSSESFTGRTRVHVTEAINPTAVYLPSHYGCTSKELKTAYGVGLRQMDFVPLQLEPGYGSAMSQEVLVTVKKVGA